MRSSAKKPAWLKVKLPEGARYKHVRSALGESGLATVCEAARCPNLGECWEAGTATFMILGEVCTRGCSFCAVRRGTHGSAIDPDEPSRVATAVSRMALDYAVVTSVTRDDLPDGGAQVFASVVQALHGLPRAPLVELLIPDFHGDSLRTVIEALPDVLAHNIEVVERLTAGMRHSRFSYQGSLATLSLAHTLAPGLLTKSSIMLGLGETDRDLEAALCDLRAAGVAILVLGQYLQPTSAHAPVVEFVPPERFAELAARGRELGFGFVAAGPLVRTSYRAAEGFAKHQLARNPR